VGQGRGRLPRSRQDPRRPFTEEPGEAAFYGPKIDFVIKDVIGREWQLGTVQVDYVLPVRFDLTYIGADNQKHTPVMIHRAPFGSMERFCGVLIEHFGGDFPVWLAPEQVRTRISLGQKSDEQNLIKFHTCWSSDLVMPRKVKLQLDPDMIAQRTPKL
jgi:threonyl-tRNA synthetase